MHFSDKYGPVDKGVQDIALPGLSSPSDSWIEGSRQKELNERGAYIHRFHNQNSCSSMVAAVKKISEDNICTPCTLVGPSLCRTYNHHVWDGCAGLLFSPSMPLALAYKGDIYSYRLNGEPDLDHQRFQTPQRNRLESLELFSEAVRTTFNGYGPTSSAFKGRRTKKLHLVVSASHNAAKIREMEKRANLYFTTEDNRSTYNLDTSSKELILHLSNRYRDFDLPQKPSLQTKVQVLEFIDAVTLAKPSLLPFLEATRIKISNFKENSAITPYFSSAGSNRQKQQYERSYTEFLEWQFNNSQTGGNLHAFSDKSTTLTPNEVLGMPSSEDLVGLVIEPSTSKSFDQALETLEFLKKAATSEWREVAKSTPPFTHLISHMDEGTILQLGWSKMVIPYSTKGLQDYCSSGCITAIDDVQFTPDYFVLLHRIASSSALVFSKTHRTVDILYLKPNVVTNFADISSDQGNKLIYEAIAQSSINEDTIRLFFHLDRLKAGNLANVDNALTNPDRTQENSRVLDSLRSMNADQIDRDLNDLLSAQINRIERSIFNAPDTHRTIKYRGGFKDHGTFEFNPQLGSLSLREGAREFENDVRLIGLFKRSGSMKHGGAELDYGIKHDKECTQFGKFNGPAAPLSISQQFSAKRNQHYFQIRFGAPSETFNINFSKSPQFVRFYFELHATPGNAAVTIQIRNHRWTDNLDPIIEHPLKVLSLLSNTVQDIDGIPPQRLQSGIVCLAALRCACSDHQMTANSIHSIGLIKHPNHKEATIQLHNQFKQVLEDTDTKLKGLAAAYTDIDPVGNDLYACLNKLPAPIGNLIRQYLVNTIDMTIQETHSTQVTPVADNRKKSPMKKLVNRFKRTFNIQP